MREFVLVACMWLHSVAAVVWIGGIIFLLGVALPALREQGGAAEVMKDIGKRFTPLANASIGILLATGFLLLLLPAEGQDWNHFFLAKIGIFVAMVSIHFFRLFALPGKVVRAETEAQRSKLKTMSLSLVKVNLALGICALLFTAAAGS
jgi:putative copper export protein